jgi:general secretion pathway protein G
LVIAMKQHHRQSVCPGFTLIELLVVLAIVSTLLMLVAPRYFSRVDASKEAVLRENLRTVRAVLDSFYGDNGRYPETLEELVEKKYLRALPVDPIAETASAWQIVPTPDGYKGAVYDIRSSSAGMDRDGRKYADW